MDFFIALFIVNVLFILIAFMLNKDNAKYLLSGYNMMSEQRRAKFNLEKFLVFYKKFFINLAIFSSAVFTVLYFLIGPKFAAFGYTVHLVIMFIWFVVKAQTFKKR